MAAQNYGSKAEMAKSARLPIIEIRTLRVMTPRSVLFIACQFRMGKQAATRFAR
jgi:hypothetical protein